MLTLIVVLLCAAAASARHDYIVGGSEAAVGAYKYQVSVKAFGSHTCGGSLIGDQWVMTAAHCAYTSASSYTVVVGMHDQAMTKGNPKSHKVSTNYKNPDYVDSGNYPNDIALMRLSTTVDPSNEFVQLATMAPDDGFTYAGSDCHISGWGLLKGDDSNVAANLQESAIDCLSNAECREYWGSSIESGHICIFDKYDNSVSACNGDSGGPMTCKRNGVRYVVGVASWVGGACDTRYPGAYTRVSEYRDWIKATSGL